MGRMPPALARLLAGLAALELGQHVVEVFHGLVGDGGDDVADHAAVLGAPL